MFRQTINSTALTSDIANSYFEHIRGEDFRGDVTFLSTLRALISPRMTEGESLYLSFGSSSYSQDTIKGTQPKRLIESICYNINLANNGLIHIHNMNSSSSDDNKACLDIIKSNFARVHNDWHRLPRVTDLFRTQFYTLCFINPEHKSVIVFVENLSTSKLHYLQCAILGLFPWYFKPEEGVSQEEMDLINTLRGREADAYSECIARISLRYDFRTARIKQQLAGFETRFEQREVERVRNTISRLDSDITRLNNDIGQKLNSRRDYEIRLLGLEAKIAEGGEESEIMDYFVRNKRLELSYVDTDVLSFIVKDYLTYFDEDTAKRIIDNQRSFVYIIDGDTQNHLIPAEKIKELMYEIFINQTLKIKICAAYQFNLAGNVSGLSHYTFGEECKGYLPNPHIQNYSCMGNYSTVINRSLVEHDYITAIEQTIASAKSINFNDSIVMATFMRCFYNVGNNTSENNKWIELPDGTSVTPTQAADWVWSQNHPEERGSSDE